jgi:hypothetical protein
LDRAPSLRWLDKDRHPAMNPPESRGRPIGREDFRPRCRTSEAAARNVRLEWEHPARGQKGRRRRVLGSWLSHRSPHDPPLGPPEPSEPVFPIFAASRPMPSKSNVGLVPTTSNHPPDPRRTLAIGRAEYAGRAGRKLRTLVLLAAKPYVEGW